MATRTTADAKMSPPPQTCVRKGFTITSQKLPILKAAPIEAMANTLGITPPEMIFGDNFVSIEHNASGWGISFNAFDALDRVDKTGAAMLKVAYSKEWQKSRLVVYRRNCTSRTADIYILQGNTLMKESKRW
jgi:type 2A phosphatase activator TIP41